MSPEKGRIVGNKEMCPSEMEFLYADILGNISSDENLLMRVTDALNVNHGYLLAQKPLFQKGASFLSHTFVRIP